MSPESSTLEYTKNIQIYLRYTKIYQDIQNTELYILVYLCISWIYLDTFRYMFGMNSIYGCFREMVG